MNNFSDKANFIWSVADLIRDTFKRGKYQDVILPFTVLRRIDCVLVPTKDTVVDAYETYGKRLDNPADLLRSKSGYAFYNISPFTFELLLNDVPNLAANLRTYMNDFSPNMRDYDRSKAAHLLKSFVERHEQTIAHKASFMIDHFHSQVAHRINGKAKAMIVTASRLHAVRYCQAVKRYLENCGYPYKVLVAFSGTVSDGSLTYEENRMNGIPETRTAETFKKDEYRILIVANKFQTGFDQPLLHTMYVDKKLGGVNAVQTLSRLNRTAPAKEETMVVDFANEAEHIQQAFQPYYEKTLLSEGTDPNLLYDLQTELSGFDLYTDAEINQFAQIYYNPQASQEQLYAVLTPIQARYKEAGAQERTQEQADFRKALTNYIRLYAFLSQIAPFTDTDLEKLYQFARHLLRMLPASAGRLPLEVQQNIDLQTYRLQQTSQGKIVLERGTKEVQPMQTKERAFLVVEELEPLSQIIAELNTQFGTDFNENDKVCILAIEERLSKREDLKDSLRVNKPDDAMLTFNHALTEVLQSMVDTHFKFYKHVTDDKAFAERFVHWLFKRYQQQER